MDLAEALRNYREKIVAQWVDYTLSTYGAAEFFSKQRDKFANPVGGNIREGLDKIFLQLAKSADGKAADAEQFREPLQQILLIRSVQEFTPSQAVAPLNAVKHITRELLAGDKERSIFIKDLYDFEFAVDLLMLSAFDIYMEARERLYKTRIAEIKSGNFILAESRCPSKSFLAEPLIPTVKNL